MLEAVASIHRWKGVTGGGGGRSEKESMIYVNENSPAKRVFLRRVARFCCKNTNGGRHDFNFGIRQVESQAGSLVCLGAEGGSCLACSFLMWA